MNSVLKDYKRLEQFFGELNYLAEACKEYDEIYHEYYIEWLENTCKKYDIEFDKNRNEWEYCVYFQTKESELEKKLESLLSNYKEKSFDDKTLEEIREIDLKIVKERLLEPNKEYLNYDDIAGAWFIGDTELVDELWYDCYTILHPKEIIGYIDEIIEDKMEIQP